MALGAITGKLLLLPGSCRSLALSPGSCSMGSFPASSSCGAYGFPSLGHLPFLQHKVPAVHSGQQQPAASNFPFLGWLCSGMPHVRCQPRSSFPQDPRVKISGKFHWADFQKVPSMWHHREFLISQPRGGEGGGSTFPLILCLICRVVAVPYICFIHYNSL